MSDSTPRVRPAFAGASAVVFLLLIPVVVHAIWDYVETRRLKATIDAIHTTRPARNVRGDAKWSQSYYRAAAALGSGFESIVPMAEAPRIYQARQTGEWPPDVVGLVRERVDRGEEMLKLVDMAAPLPFDGFVSSDAYQTSGLFTVSMTCALRAIVRAADGDGDGAVAALYSQARLTEPLASPWSVGVSLRDVEFVLSRTRPSPASLMNLSTGLGDPFGGEDGLRRGLMRLRAQMIDDPEVNPIRQTLRRHWTEAIARPWMAHALNTRLAIMNRMIAAAEGPWPRQIERVVAVAPDTAMLSGNPSTWKTMAASLANAQGSALARFRVARSAVAVEAYARDHHEQMPPSLDSLAPQYLSAVPVDPFSGKPLSIQPGPGGYRIYSVGPDRRDDNGDVQPRKAGEKRTNFVDGPDIGMEIRLQRP